MCVKKVKMGVDKQKRGSVVNVKEGLKALCFEYINFCTSAA
jgi:hypothetical protein